MLPLFFLFCLSQLTHVSAWGVANVVSFGADDRGKNLSTNALHSALAFLQQQGGGSLYFPAGTYLSGPFNLTSNIELLLDAATLVAGPPSTFLLILFVTTHTRERLGCSECCLFWC